MPKLLTENDVSLWLQENKPEIQLVLWAGKANEKSKFKNLNYGTEFEMEFKFLKYSIKKNPKREFGIPLSLRSKKIADAKEEKTGSRGSKNLKEKTVKDWLQENKPDIQLVSWAGQSIKVSKFKDIKRNVEFEISFENLKKIYKRNPDTIFGATKDEKTQQARQTFQKNWGVDNPNKIKKIRKKIKKTIKEKYGVEYLHQNEEIKKKAQDTTNKRWGVQNISQHPEIKQKIVKNNLEKYGVSHFFQIPEIIEKKKKAWIEKDVPFKIKKTIKEKYGVEYLHQNEEIKKKAQQTKIKKGLTKTVDGKTFKEWAKDSLLGCETSIRKQYKRKGRHPSKVLAHRSELELDVREFLLEDLKFQEVQSLKEIQSSTDFLWDKKLPELKRLAKEFKRPDFCFYQLKLIIECDGEYYHIRTPDQKEKDKQRNQLYTDLGYDVLVFDGQFIINYWGLVKDIIVSEIETKLNE